MQKKEEVVLSHENEKKNLKKSLLCLRASYLYRKIVLSDPVEGRSISHHSLRLWSLGRRSRHRDDNAYLSFINRVFLNVTKHLKLALFIEEYNSLSKKR